VEGSITPVSRTRAALVGVVAAGLMLMSAGAASAAPTVENEFDNIVVGNSWWLESPTEITTNVSTSSSSESREGPSVYTSQIQQPINPNGSSTWPAKRGVLPVQFKLSASPTTETATTTTTTTAVTKVPSFESIGSDNDASNDWSALTHVPPTGTTVEGITNLTANYAWVIGTNHGGSLRWVINASGGPIWAHHGSYPNFTDNAAPGSGDNLISQSDLRFDASGRGGPTYATWNDIVTLYGSEAVGSVALTIDGGWGGDQEIDLSSATVNGSTVNIADSYAGAPDVDLNHDGYDDAWVPGPSLVTLTTGAWVPGPLGAPVQTNAVPAKLVVKKFNDGNNTEVVNEVLSSAQGDATGMFRQIDGKYMYNLKIESLTGPGDYRVYMNINGQDVLTSPGEFSLR
jgi:hypothetical protein